jgi:hypothetical protein
MGTNATGGRMIFLLTVMSRVSSATLDSRGGLTLSKEFRERYGDHYRIVDRHGEIELIPVANDPLDALRDELAAVTTGPLPR